MLQLIIEMCQILPHTLNCLAHSVLLGFWILSIVRYSKQNMFRKLHLFLLSGRKVGTTYSDESIRKRESQSLLPEPRIWQIRCLVQVEELFPNQAWNQPNHQVSTALRHQRVKQYRKEEACWSTAILQVKQHRKGREVSSRPSIRPADEVTTEPQLNNDGGN
jgi:hypothetical protein